MYVQEKKHVWIEFFPHLRFLRADQGVIPASLLTINSPTQYQGYIRFNEREREIDIRLYEHRTDIKGNAYFPEHPLNGVHRVSNQIDDR
jgi:hypothetical protein